MTHSAKLSILSAALLSGLLSACGGGDSKDGDNTPDLLQAINIPTLSVHCPYAPTDNVGKDNGVLNVADLQDFSVKAAALPGVGVEAKDIDWTWTLNGEDVTKISNLKVTDTSENDGLTHIMQFKFQPDAHKVGDKLTINIHAARRSNPDHGAGNNQCELTVL